MKKITSSNRKYSFYLLLLSILTLFLSITITPTQAAVTLVSFTGEANGGQVLLNWETATELDNAGFYISRSEQEDSGYARVSDFIPAEGDGLTGAIYNYTDQNLTLGATYFYKLEAIDYNQNINLHGPVAITINIPPTETPLPTDTPTPIPTNTPIPTEMPLPTNTPIPTETALPTNTPTPLPTEIVLPTFTPTPIPTKTPLPTNTAIPTYTPLPIVSINQVLPTPSPISIALPTPTRKPIQVATLPPISSSNIEPTSTPTAAAVAAVVVVPPTETVNQVAGESKTDTTVQATNEIVATVPPIANEVVANTGTEDVVTVPTEQPAQAVVIKPVPRSPIYDNIQQGAAETDKTADSRLVSILGALFIFGGTIFGGSLVLIGIVIASTVYYITKHKI